MVKSTPVSITLRDNRTGEYVHIPVIPSRVEYQEGDAMVDSVKILNLGNIDFHNGVDLDTMGWTSFFPARHDAGYVKIAGDKLKDPKDYRDIINEWKKTGQPLQLIIPVVDINVTMYVASFIWDLHGFEKDIHYTLSLKQHREIRPKQYNTDTGTIEDPNNLAMQDRQAIPEQAKENPYTVKSGDTLTLVAKRNGTDWQTIYDNNRDMIGDDPNNIQPGQELVV